MSASPTAAAMAKATRPAATTPFTPVTFFSGLGVFWLSVLAFEWGTWLFTGKAHPVDPGPTPMPDWMWVSLRGSEIAYTIAVFYTMYVLIWKPWKRERRLTFDGMIVIAFYVMWSLSDAWATYFAPLFAYNANAINLGCPQCQLPGALHPNWSTHYVEPFFLLALYGAGLTAGTLAGCRFMRKVHEIRPQTGKLAMFFLLFPVMMVADILLEIPMQIAGLWAYANAMPELTLFYGHYYQYPIYEGILMWVMWSGFAFMRYYKDDRGETLVERGLSQMKLSEGQKTRKRLLAIIGCICTVALVAYHIPFMFITIHAQDIPPDILQRSYFMHGNCGPGTKIACPGTQIPAPTGPRSAYLTPEGTWVTPTGLPIQATQTAGQVNN